MTCFKCTINWYLQSDLSGLSTYCCFSLYRKAETLQMSSSNDEVFIPMSRRNTNDLPRTTSNDLKTFTEVAVLSFHNINYRVKVTSGFLLGRKTVEKEILTNIKYVHELVLKQLYWLQWAWQVLLIANKGITFVYNSIQTYRHVLLFLVAELGVKWLDHILGVWLTLKKLPNWESGWLLYV